MSLEDDRTEILRLHGEWIESNTGLDIDRMERVFPVGDDYLMFNCNGHPYYGIGEKVHLWNELRHVMDYRMVDEYNHRLEISGDMAWLACEGTSEFLDTQDDNRPDRYHWRDTEVYMRDDGAGNPEWRMWHFHCSHHAPDEANRPGFGDTAQGRKVRPPEGVLAVEGN